jgi:hypothetical protein
MTIQTLQSRSLTDSTLLSKWYLTNMIEPAQVIRVLNENEISFVLVGLHGLSAWMREPRGTKDVDVVVTAKQVKKAVQVLVEAFPNLESIDLPVVVRLKDRGTDDVLIDVMKPVQQPARSVFRNCVVVQQGEESYRIPTLEMGLALKFAPMISLSRAEEDKYQDAHDFIRMVKNNAEIDLNKLKLLGELVYVGGGKEIVEMVRKVRAGEKLRL